MLVTRAPTRLDETITTLAKAETGRNPTATAAARATIAECDAKLERYRAALDAGADPAVVTEWIARTQTERTRAKAHLHTLQTAGPRTMSRTEITNLVRSLGDIITVLRDADPADEAEVYRQLGLRLVYQPETQTVRAEVDLNADRKCMDRVRGAIDTTTPPVHEPDSDLIIDSASMSGSRD